MEGNCTNVSSSTCDIYVLSLVWMASFERTLNECFDMDCCYTDFADGWRTAVRMMMPLFRRS